MVNFATDISTSTRGLPAKSPKANWSAVFRRCQLTFSVHVDALRFDPLSYGKALWWRLRGLRVRSRNKLAELMGRSPRAYDLWMAKVEPALLRQHLPETRSAASIITLVDCSSGSGGLDETLGSLGDNTGRVVLISDETTDGIMERIRHPRELASSLGENQWLCCIQAGDRLAPDALTIYASVAACSAGRRIIYSDDDLIAPTGQRSSPHFKPGWNPELFDHHDFVTGSSIVRVTSHDLNSVLAKDWAAQIVRAAIEYDPAPVHIPIVLHHRRQRPSPHPPIRTTQASPPTASVGVVIPTRNQLPLLRKCIEGLEGTDYPAIEIIVVDNESDDPDVLAYLQELEGKGMRVLRCPGPFNYSALNNAAVRTLQTDYLCFLNNDVEMLDGDWLKPLVGQASRQDIGAVGARLLYPDGTVQHAGVFTGIGGGAGHAHRFLRDSDAGYFDRDRLPQRVSAVTGACLVVAREKFEAVGGFDEVDFPVAFNDVDLCLKLDAHGWQSFYEPRATLIHHESKSRGSDRAKANRKRFAGELAALKRKWRTDEICDPYHNPNLSPFCEQFLIAV